MRYSELLETAVTLRQLYSDAELRDEQEAIFHRVDAADLDHKFVVHEMSPDQAKTYLTLRGDMTVVEAFQQFATKDQKRLVRYKVRHFDASRVIVTEDHCVIDGSHHLMAGVVAQRPIKYIDLAERPTTNAEPAA